MDNKTLAQILNKCEVVASKDQSSEKFNAYKNGVKEWVKIRESVNLIIWQSKAKDYILIKYYQSETLYKVKKYEQLSLFK